MANTMPTSQSESAIDNETGFGSMRRTLTSEHMLGLPNAPKSDAGKYAYGKNFSHPLPFSVYRVNKDTPLISSILGVSKGRHHFLRL